jgi:LysM repeat protein
MQDLEIASPKTAFIFTTAPDTRSQNRIPSNQIIVNSLIKKIANSGNYSIFDLNEAMGGWGSIYSWFKKRLTLKDKLHFTEQGYSLQANLFTLSLLEAYNSINFHDTININQTRSIVKDSMESILRNSKNDSLIKFLEAHNKKQSSVSKNSTNKIHIVKKGDTISKLCRIYKISQKIILNTNNLSKKSILKIGEKIIIVK